MYNYHRNGLDTMAKNKSRDKEEVRRQGGIGAHASIGASLTPGLSDPLLR